MIVCIVIIATFSTIMATVEHVVISWANVKMDTPSLLSNHVSYSSLTMSSIANPVPKTNVE